MRLPSYVLRGERLQKIGRRRWPIRMLGIFTLASLVCLSLTLQSHAAGPAFLVKVLNIPANRDPGTLASVGRDIYFRAWDPDTGVELWKSDGTPEGTVMVKDIDPGTASSWPYSLTNVGGKLLFSATDDLHGFALWKSDGTPDGTVMVKQVPPFMLAPYTLQYEVVNDVLFFEAGDQLWKSDGTPEGTVMITDPTITAGRAVSYPSNANGTVFFMLYPDLWRTDGTTEGTQLVKDFESDGPNELAAANETLLFPTTDYTDDIKTGYRLWKSDGTSEGTVPLKEFAAQLGIYGINEFVSVSDNLFFLIRYPNRMDVWRSDGTSAGTMLVETVCVEAGQPYYAQSTEANGTLFFSCGEAGASLSSGYELWKSDGTAGETQLVKAFDPNPLGSVLWLTNVNGTLCMAANEGIYGMEPWQSDGTTAGTQFIQDIAPGAASSFPRWFTATDTHMFFTADDGINGRALWAMPLSALLPPVSRPTPTITPAPTSTPVATPNKAVRVYLPRVSNED